MAGKGYFMADSINGNVFLRLMTVVVLCLGGGFASADASGAEASRNVIMDFDMKNDVEKRALDVFEPICLPLEPWGVLPLAFNKDGLLFRRPQEDGISLFRYDPNTDDTERLFDLEGAEGMFFTTASIKDSSIGYAMRVARGRRMVDWGKRLEAGWDIGLVGTDQKFKLRPGSWSVNDQSDVNDDMLALSLHNGRVAIILVYHSERKQWLSQEVASTSRVALVHGSVDENGIDFVAISKKSSRTGQYYHWDFEKGLNPVADWSAELPENSSVMSNQPYYLLGIDEGHHLAFLPGSQIEVFLKIENTGSNGYETTIVSDLGSTSSYAQLLKVSASSVLFHNGRRGDDISVQKIDAHSLQKVEAIKDPNLISKLKSDAFGRVYFIGGNSGNSYMFLKVREKPCLVDVNRF